MLSESEKKTSDAQEKSGLARSDIVIATWQLGAAIAPVGTLRVEAFPASADHLAHVRQTVWDMTAGHATCGVATLLSGELAANAIEHGGSRFVGLALGKLPTGLSRIVVVDEGHRRFPHPRACSSPGRRGRGLRVVDTLALQWGVIRRAHAGAAVWFET